MAFHKDQEFVDNLPKWADEYIDVCIGTKKEVATGSGKIVEIRDRHLPTISYFTQIWLPKNKGESITRDCYYKWLNGDNEQKADLIKHIDNKFRALATDIVANEQKGIFYAKNYLGMTDRVDTKNENFNHDVTAEFGGAKSDE